LPCNYPIAFSGDDMMKKLSSGWFVSIKWKLVIGISLFMLLVGSILGAVAFHKLKVQQEYQLEGQAFRLAQSLRASLNQQLEKAALSAGQLVFMLEEHDTGGGVDQNFMRLTDKHWLDIQLLWNLQAIALVNEGRAVQQGGERLTTRDSQWLDSNSQAVKPVWRVECHQACHFQALVPVVFKGEMRSIFLVMDLAEILARLRVDDEIELAVFGPALMQKEGVHFWGRRLYSVSNSVRSMPLLGEAEAGLEWAQLTQTHSSYELKRESWALWNFPLGNANDGPSLLVMANIHEWQALLRQFQQSVLGIILLSLLLTGVLVTLLIWSPMSRLNRHAQLLPLLADHRFDELRQAMPRTHSGLLDEVDLLNVATHRLTDRLQSLELEVDASTLELRRLAMLDSLTGLPNKAMLLHELNKAIACVGRLHSQLALLYLDLDEFKRINDSLGHSEGDELLRIIAGRLNNCVRDMDTVFRQGGDEFLILLRCVRTEQDVRTVIHKVFACLQKPIALKNHKLIVTTSIGVALCHSPSMSAEELIRHADLAMYQAKGAGRSNFRMFSPEMQLKANNRLMIEQDIGAAISEKQLTLFLQPIVALPDGELKGFEALIRWFHPKRGLIMPGDFIPDIEESDAIIQVGNYVLEQGIALLGRLLESGWNELYLALNLSAKHYLSPGLTDFIQRLLAKQGISPARLLLEVTEESVIEQVDQAMAVMVELKQLGVRIAIDDFGTGYSSLSYLKQLPFDVLKIDRCFTSGVLENGVDTHIVTTVIDLAHNLQRIVVAEGVETQGQADFMAKMGGELAQGYLYSRPHDEAHIMSILELMEEDHIWPKADMLMGHGKLVG
jgi:c-di-GMP phosphodiesterase